MRTCRKVSCTSTCLVALVTPRAGLRVRIGEVAEQPPRVEVVLDVVKGPLDTCRAVGVALLVGHEPEAEAFAERLHFGSDHRVLPRTVRNDDVGVVDHALGCGAAEETHRVGQEGLGVEPVEAGVQLREDHP
jgi:hypothetical protein